MPPFSDPLIPLDQVGTYVMKANACFVGEPVFMWACCTAIWMVLAISYLHGINILYRDLKPSNVMIDRDGHIGIVDFGLSKQGISGKSHGVKTLSGTAEYVAPEALVQYSDGSRDYGKSYDWWSLGIVLVRATLLDFVLDLKSFVV